MVPTFPVTPCPAVTGHRDVPRVLPGHREPGTITDFNGFTGVGHITGTGTGANAGLSFDVDNRFLTGEYIALDGRHFNATFDFL
jgi:hypothetical protein